MTTPMLTLSYVNKWSGPVDVLNDISLEIFPGERLRRLGGIGAGALTLIAILPGVHMPTSGILEMDAQQVAFAAPREVGNPDPRRTERRARRQVSGA